MLLNWIFLWLQNGLWSRPVGPRPQQREHCTPQLPLCLHQLHCLVIWNSKPSGPSHLTVTIHGQPTAVCWREGDRWETGKALYVSVWVSVSEGWVGGWVRTSQAYLQSYWHAESHISWAEKSVYRHAEVGVFQRASDSRLNQGWDPENTHLTAHSSLPSTTTLSPFI